MKTKMLLATLVLAAAPTMTLAQCFGHEKEQVTMSCAEGTVYDAESQSCISTTS